MAGDEALRQELEAKHAEEVCCNSTVYGYIFLIHYGIKVSLGWYDRFWIVVDLSELLSSGGGCDSSGFAFYTFSPRTTDQTSAAAALASYRTNYGPKIDRNADRNVDRICSTDLGTKTPTGSPNERTNERSNELSKPTNQSTVRLSCLTGAGLGGSSSR